MDKRQGSNVARRAFNLIAFCKRCGSILGRGEGVADSDTTTVLAPMLHLHRNLFKTPHRVRSHRQRTSG